MNADDPTTPANAALDAHMLRWATRMVEQLAQRGRGADTSPRHLMRLTNQAARGDLAMDLLFALAPETADAELWVDWLQGQASPSANLRTPQFVEGPANSGRKIKSALSKAKAAEIDVDQARLKLSKAQEELLAAEACLHTAEDLAKRQRDVARGAAGWALLNEAARLSSSVFAMGPAWSLLRIVSGHLSDPPGWEESESAETRDLVTKHRDTRSERSVEILQALAARSSDPAFEIDLFDWIYEFVVTHADPNTSASSKSARGLRDGVGSHAKTDDARQVAAGVSREANH